LINLKLFGLADASVRENFSEIDREFRESPILMGSWAFFEKAYKASGTFKLFHGLGFIPKDIIVTSSRGAGSAIFLHDNFTEDYIEIQVVAPITLRFLLGKVK
jgi:hypothetical protein